MSRVLTTAFLILENNFRKNLFLKEKKNITKNQLSKLLVENSSKLMNLIYLIYSISLIFVELFPRSIGKIIIRKIYSPDLNPITKTLLFYLYHNDY